MQVLPECSGELMKQTMIFVPSYFDFVRLRNHMSREEMNFVPLSEHTSSSDVSRARSHFFHGHTHFLLCTERIHFFKRYNKFNVPVQSFPHSLCLYVCLPPSLLPSPLLSLSLPPFPPPPPPPLTQIPHSWSQTSCVLCSPNVLGILP